MSRRPEAAAVLRRLCRRVPAGKEPAAARFYREEGNRLFGRRHYGTAVRLYSQVGEAGAGPGPPSEGSWGREGGVPQPPLRGSR